MTMQRATVALRLVAAAIALLVILDTMHPGPKAPRAWWLYMRACQRVAHAVGREAIAAELAYTRAARRASLADGG